MVVAVAAALLPWVARAQLAKPHHAVENLPMRRGFTLELGFGAAFTHIAGVDSVSGFGITPIAIGLGGFLTPKLAILAREGGTTMFRTNAAGDQTQLLALHYGVQVQYWATDLVSFAAGPALAVYGDNPLVSSGSDFDVGFGGSARIGYSLLAIRHHVVRVSWETFNSKVSDVFVFGSALTLEWQYF